MADDDYVSPYTVDDRTRRSVMAAQVSNKSIQEVQDGDFRRSTPRKFPRFQPEFNGDSFLSALSTITVVIEGLCFEGAEGWDEVQRLVPEKPRVSSRLIGGPSQPTVNFGNDRATLSLYDPLENLRCMLTTFSSQVNAWATKATYFKGVARPFIIRTIENSTSEASTAEKLRKEINYVGPIDMSYVNSFEALSGSMEEPILELRTLGEFIASILEEGDEIPHSESGQDGPSGSSTTMKSSLSNPSSPFAKVPSPVAEASSSAQSGGTKGASTVPTSSAFFNAILNPEPITQAATSGRENTEDTVDERGEGHDGFQELLETARFDFDSNKKSSSFKHKSESESTIDRQHSSSPGYTSPPSPSISVDTLAKSFSVPWIKVEEPSRDFSCSNLLQRSSYYGIKPSPASPGTPQWKIDLSERKGHPIRILHVGPRELEILAKCLPLVEKATQKGEKCLRAIVKMNALANEMEKEYKEWDEFCSDLEDEVRIEKRKAREKQKEEGGYTKVDDVDDDNDNDDDDDDDKSKAKVKAKDLSVYEPDAYDYEGNDWFGTGGSSIDYGRVGPRDAHNAWGYRKFDAPSSTRRRSSLPYTDPDETEDEYKEYRRGAKDFGMNYRSPAERGLRMGSLESMSVSERSDGVEEVTNFEEAFGGVDEQDLEMLDVDEGEGGGSEQGEIVEEAAAVADQGERSAAAGEDGEEGEDGGKMGLKNGKRVLGLYGEEL